MLCCKSEEKPPNSYVGLSSNSWHAYEFMAVGANLIGQQCIFWFGWLSSGFLVPYDSPIECQMCHLDLRQNPLK